jgi:hypothetical protein
MDQLLQGWTAYQGWAGNLDSEGRFYIIAVCLLLLVVYAGIYFSAPDRSDESSNSAKTNKTLGKDQRR